MTTFEIVYVECNPRNLCEILKVYRGIVQLVERWSPKPNVEGSSPSTPAITIHPNSVMGSDVVRSINKKLFFRINLYFGHKVDKISLYDLFITIKCDKYFINSPLWKGHYFLLLQDLMSFSFCKNKKAVKEKVIICKKST